MNKKVLIAFLALVIIWVIGAAFLPVVLDEAYYFLWARYPSFGYFDHPPLVALMSLGSVFESPPLILCRVGTLIFGVLTLVGAKIFYRSIFADKKTVYVLALVFAFFNLGSLVMGFLSTPDTGLALCWVWTLVCAMAAMRGKSYHWLTSGLFIGLGMLAKYTMVLMGPVLLLILLFRSPREIFTRWTLGGAFLAILIFSPNLIWNMKNNWITIRHQTTHGFSLSKDGLLGRSRLPPPEMILPAGPEREIGQYFDGLEGPSKPRKKAIEKPRIQRMAESLGDFLGGEMLLWGGFLIPLAFLSFQVLRKKSRLFLRQDLSTLDKTSLLFLVVPTLVPLIFFGLISLFSKIEANWAAMHLLTAGGLAAALLKDKYRLCLSCAVSNSLLILAVILHANFPFIRMQPNRDRILNETHGYKQLAEKIKNLDAPLFADSYQIVSMISFYQRSSHIEQWPGITRPSEFLRNAKLANLSWMDLNQKQSFWLVTTERIPPRFPDFVVNRASQLRDCSGLDFEVNEAQFPQQTALICAKPIHIWYLLKYESLVKNKGTKNGSFYF